MDGMNEPINQSINHMNNKTKETNKQENDD